MTAKGINRQIHLWLGLASGLVVFILGLTGCILVFEQEIRGLLGTSREAKTVKLKNSPAAEPSAIFQNALQSLPDGGSSLYYITNEKSNGVVITWHYSPAKTKASEGQWIVLTQDPYSGRVLTKEIWSTDFWGFVTRLHTSLLLPEHIGGQITSYATLVFIVLMVTGLVLWYPKNKKNLKRSFSVKWNASPKRLNYDLHNVLGFYVTWVAIFIAFTGIVFGLDWFRNGLFSLTTGGEKLDLGKRQTSALVQNWKQYPTSHKTALIDSIASEISQKYHEGLKGIQVSYPLDSLAPINISVLTLKGENYFRHDEFSYDQYSGRLLASELWSDQNAGERIIHINYPIHLGSIGGLPTKIMAFFASLISASLPVTGFYIWWGKRRKSKKKLDKDPKLKNSVPQVS